MTVRPAKTQTRLGGAWAESSLCAQWVAKHQSFLHADSESLIRLGGCVVTGRTCHFVGFVMRRLIYTLLQEKTDLSALRLVVLKLPRVKGANSEGSGEIRRLA